MDKADVLFELPCFVKYNVSALAPSCVMNRHPGETVEFEFVVLWGESGNIVYSSRLPTLPEKEAKLEFDMIADKRLHVGGMVDNRGVSRTWGLAFVHESTDENG